MISPSTLLLVFDLVSIVPRSTVAVILNRLGLRVRCSSLYSPETTKLCYLLYYYSAMKLSVCGVKFTTDLGLEKCLAPFRESLRSYVTLSK